MVRQALRALSTMEVEVNLVIGDRVRHDTREFDFPTVRTSELRRVRYDAVWYPWNGMRFSPHASAIVTVHDPFAFTFPHRNLVARLREQRPIRRALRCADIIFTPSHWTAGELIARFNIAADRIQVVPNAPDPFWHPVAEQARDRYMLVLGSRERRKNISMLIRAYTAAFDEQGPQLIIVGKLSDSDARALAQMRAPHRRVHATDEELRGLYSGALAVLVPSLAEGFGLPVLEAMACGAAVLATDATALPQTCGRAALLAAPETSAWTSALQRLFGDAGLRERLRAAGISHAAGFDPNGPARALIAYVRQSLSAAR